MFDTQKMAIIGAVGAVMVAALITQTVRLGNAQGKIGKLETQITQAIDANKSNQDTIDVLEFQLAEVILQIQIDQTAAEVAASENRLERERLIRARDKAEIELNEIFNATPSCKELARLDLGMCPRVVDRLRQLSRDLDSD